MLSVGSGGAWAVLLLAHCQKNAVFVLALTVQRNLSGLCPVASTVSSQFMGRHTGVGVACWALSLHRCPPVSPTCICSRFLPWPSLESELWKRRNKSRPSPFVFLSTFDSVLFVSFFKCIYTTGLSEHRGYILSLNGGFCVSSGSSVRPSLPIARLRVSFRSPLLLPLGRLLNRWPATLTAIQAQLVRRPSTWPCLRLAATA
jgi:hypothetical protein